LREQSLIDFVDAALKRPSDAPIKGS
jgi:hypothetical protein